MERKTSKNAGIMDTLTKNKLKMLEAQHTKDGIKKRPRLKVYYGFSKINKIQKREAIQVNFENEAGAGSDTSRSGKQLRKQMDIVTERWQTEQETADASMYTRVFTTYYIFLDDKKIGGSLKRALLVNSEADKNHVCEKDRKNIMERLECAYLAAHIGYKEPSKQLELDFK